MSYHDHTSALAREVAWLITSRASLGLDARGVGEAAASRGQVLALARCVLADVAPAGAPSRGAAFIGQLTRSSEAVYVPPPVALIQDAPVAALARALAAHPDLPLAHSRRVSIDYATRLSAAAAAWRTTAT